MSAQVRPGRHDNREPRRSKRSGREKGCWTYIPAEQLAAIGIPLDGDPPMYLTSTPKDGRPRVFVNLYREQA